MTRDLKGDAAAVCLAIEQFGSVAHLARALGVSQEELEAWRSGIAEMPPGTYHRLLELIAGSAGI